MLFGCIFCQRTSAKWKKNIDGTSNAGNWSSQINLTSDNQSHISNIYIHGGCICGCGAHAGNCSKSNIYSWTTVTCLCSVCMYCFSISFVFFTTQNWQNWKRLFLLCYCHENYRVEAVDLKIPIILKKIQFLWICEIWVNLLKHLCWSNNWWIQVQI